MKLMFHAIRGGFTLAVTLLILKALLPEVADGLVAVFLKMLAIASTSIDSAQAGDYITGGLPL